MIILIIIILTFLQTTLLWIKQLFHTNVLCWSRCDLLCKCHKTKQLSSLHLKVKNKTNKQKTLQTTFKWSRTGEYDVMRKKSLSLYGLVRPHCSKKASQGHKPIRIRIKENTEPNPQPAIKQASSAQVWAVEKCSLWTYVCESERCLWEKVKWQVWVCVLKRVCETGKLLTCGCMLLILWSGCQEDCGASGRPLIDCPAHNNTLRPQPIYIPQDVRTAHMVHTFDLNRDGAQITTEAK